MTDAAALTDAELEEMFYELPVPISRPSHAARSSCETSSSGSRGRAPSSVPTVESMRCRQVHGSGCVGDASLKRSTEIQRARLSELEAQRENNRSKTATKRARKPLGLNPRRPWTDADKALLTELLEQECEWHEIAERLKRGVEACKSMIKRMEEE